MTTRLEVTTPQDIFGEILRLVTLASIHREHAAEANYRSLMKWLMEPIDDGEATSDPASGFVPPIADTPRPERAANVADGVEHIPWALADGPRDVEKWIACSCGWNEKNDAEGDWHHHLVDAALDRTSLFLKNTTEAALELLVKNNIHGGLPDGYCAVCEGQCLVADLHPEGKASD